MKRRGRLAFALPLFAPGNAGARASGKQKVRHTEEAGGFKLTIAGSLLEVRRKNGKLHFRMGGILHDEEGYLPVELPKRMLSPSAQQLFVPMHDSSYRIINVDGYDADNPGEQLEGSCPWTSPFNRRCDRRAWSFEEWVSDFVLRGSATCLDAKAPDGQDILPVLYEPGGNFYSSGEGVKQSEFRRYMLEAGFQMHRVSLYRPFTCYDDGDYQARLSPEYKPKH
jgi:hypothetical protein